MIRLVPTLLLCAAACYGCGGDGQQEPGDTASLGVWTRDEVDTGPGELAPNVQLDDTSEDGGGVYVALWSRPRTAGGDGEFPRSICLPMSVDNHDERALVIRASFEPAVGAPVPAPPANCGDQSAIPTRLEPGQSVDGALGFYVPAGGGRLVLTGSHNFDWYVDIAE